MERRDDVEEPAHGAGQAARELDVGKVVQQQPRVRAGDDAGAEDVDADVSARGGLGQRALDLGLLARVVEGVGAARGDVLGERKRVLVVEAVGGDGRGVDEPARAAGGDGGLEDVARAAQVDLVRVAGRAHDDEGEVDDDVGLGHEVVDGGTVEHVALAVLRLRPAALVGVEVATGHAEDAIDRRLGLERGDEGLADLAGRSGDGDGEVPGCALGGHGRQYPGSPGRRMRAVSPSITTRGSTGRTSRPRAKSRIAAAEGKPASCSRCLMVGKTSSSSPSW